MHYFYLNLEISVVKNLNKNKNYYKSFKFDVFVSCLMSFLKFNKDTLISEFDSFNFLAHGLLKKYIIKLNLIDSD